MNTVFHTKIYGGFTEVKSNFWGKKLHRTNKGSNLLESSFCNRDNARTPIQFRRERKFQHLKRYFTLRAGPHIFTSIAPKLLDWLNKLNFFSIEINKLLPGQVQCLICHIQVEKPTLVEATNQTPDCTYNSSIISRDSSITDNIIRKVMNVE